MSVFGVAFNPGGIVWGMTKQKALVLALVVTIVVIGAGLVIALLVGNPGGRKPEVITNPDGSKTTNHYYESGQIRYEWTTNPGGYDTHKYYYESGRLEFESTF